MLILDVLENKDNGTTENIGWILLVVYSILRLFIVVESFRFLGYLPSFRGFCYNMVYIHATCDLIEEPFGKNTMFVDKTGIKDCDYTK